ncbi:MAG: hypothetical protein ACL7AY_15290 [Candidatus Arsenophonus phytopathogenicus]
MTKKIAKNANGEKIYFPLQAICSFYEEKNDGDVLSVLELNSGKKYRFFMPLSELFNNIDLNIQLPVN